MARGSANRRLKEKRSKRERLAEAQAWRCAYCGVRMRIPDDPVPGELAHLRPFPRTFVQALHLLEATIDEVIPRALGGPTSWENQVAACRACNEIKGQSGWKLGLRRVQNLLESGDHPHQKAGIL